MSLVLYNLTTYNGRKTTIHSFEDQAESDRTSLIITGYITPLYSTHFQANSPVIQDPASDPSSRVKKRRDVSGRPRGVFRLAETVPPTWQGKGDEAEALKTRIKGLLHVKDMEDEEMQMNAPESGPSIPRPSPPITRTDAGPSTSISVSTTQYRVIPPMSPRSRLMLPPKVYSHKE